MNITVNGEITVCNEGATLLDLILRLGLSPEKIVVERNRDIVPAGTFAETALQDGDTLELLQFVGLPLSFLPHASAAGGTRQALLRTAGCSFRSVLLGCLPRHIFRVFTQGWAMKTSSDALIIGGVELHSRLFIGTGKYGSDSLIPAVAEASGAEVITVALRRVDLGNSKDNVLSHIPGTMRLLPNTSGARTADEAVRIARPVPQDVATGSKSKSSPTRAISCPTATKPPKPRKPSPRKASPSCRT